jgi:hypothetical protein
VGRVVALNATVSGINNIVVQNPPVVRQPIAGAGEPNTYPTSDLRQRLISAATKF